MLRDVEPCYARSLVSLGCSFGFGDVEALHLRGETTRGGRVSAMRALVSFEPAEGCAHAMLYDAMPLRALSGKHSLQIKL